MNKKIIASVVVLAAIVICVIAAPQMKTFSTTGSPAAAASVTIPGERGYILNESMMVDVATNANMTIYRARDISSAEAAVSATTNINVYTQGSNSWSGFTPTAATDYILVRNATSGYQLSQIKTIVSYNSTTNFTSYTLETALTAAADDPVYVVDATDNVTVPLKASSTVQMALRNIFTGKRDMPVNLNIPVTAGNSVLSGTYTIQP